MRRFLIIAGLIVGVALGVTSTHAAGVGEGPDVDAGIEAWQKADYNKAISIWRPLAESGDANAAFNLGQAYRLGRGVPANLAAAKSWFERAAQKNHLDAQTTLGLLLLQTGEQVEGLKWMKVAAERGERRALLVYGTALFNGDGVTQDRPLGYAYVSRAAAQGLGPAKETLAQLDTLLPPEQRKNGVAMAKAKGQVAPSAGPSKAAKAAPPSKPVQAASAKPAPNAATEAASATGGWRIQVGAFGSRSEAEAAYRKIAGVGALAGRSPQYIPFRQFIRLRVGPFASQASAAAACNAVHVPCFPVPPEK